MTQVRRFARDLGPYVLVRLLHAIAVRHGHGPAVVAAIEKRLAVVRQGSMVAVMEEGSRTGRVAVEDLDAARSALRLKDALDALF
jgi:hypothetical protein